jgi:ABC-type bacteriocin/lantibiotic exporter with double-glycine peptidase domain
MKIPLILQQSPTANYRWSDCGAACVAMVLAYMKKLGKLTVDDLAKMTVLEQIDRGLDSVEMSDLLNSLGVQTRVRSDVTTDQIKKEIDTNRPVIAETNWRNGHAIVVTDYNDIGFQINDPANVFTRISPLNLEKSMIPRGRTCVFVVDDPPAIAKGTHTITEYAIVSLAPNSRAAGNLRRGDKVQVIDTQGKYSKIEMWIDNDALDTLS